MNDKNPATHTQWDGKKKIWFVGFEASINEKGDVYNLFSVNPLGNYKIGEISHMGVKLKSELGGGGHSIFFSNERLSQFTQIILEAQAELKKHKLV